MRHGSRVAWAACCAVVAAEAAQAQRRVGPSLRVEAREAREARALRQPGIEGLRASDESVQKGEKPPPRWTLALGVATDGDSDGAKERAAPFVLAYQTAPDGAWWKFRASGGYARDTDADGASARGIGDLAFDISHAYTDTWSWTLGATVPTGGEIGSSAASQYATLLYAGTTAIAGGLPTLGGTLKHANGGDGTVSAYSQTLHLDWARDFASGSTLVLGLDASHRRATATQTDPFVELDVPISKTLAWSAVATRGVAGVRHTAFELDLIVKF